MNIKKSLAFTPFCKEENLNNDKILIVGFGKTGLSLANYFFKNNIAFDVFEENVHCENLIFLKDIHIFHQITAAQLQHYQTIYLSPGVNPHLALYANVQAKLSNDLNIFTQNVSKPYIAITGSNGKSTLVHLLEVALCGAGYKAIAIGNNGVPMLDHLNDDIDYFILELSSYQLELAQPFLCEIAYVSNISQDHLDRHGTIEHYAAIKETLYQNCRYAVINNDDEFCRVMSVISEKTVTVCELPMNLQMMGRHNYHNARAVMTMIQLLNLNKDLALQAIEAFPGLEHRCEFIAQKNDVTWWNDSKATNVASTITAIHSLSEIATGKLVMILGGQSKGQDFSELVNRLQNKARVIILLGECKRALEKLFIEHRDSDQAEMTYRESVIVVETLQQAVQVAKQYTQSGDAVLLSPACASLDMFKNYEDRGRQFKALVNQ